MAVESVRSCGLAKHRPISLGNGVLRSGVSSEIDEAEKLNKEKNDQANSIKVAVNVVGNGGAALSNLLTFINGNSGFLSIEQDTLEKFSSIMTKVATGLQGLILSIDTFSKRNLIPFIGYVAEIPIAVFSSDFNLWLYRGFSQGLGQFQGIMDRKRLEIKGKDQRLEVEEFENGFKKTKDLYASSLFNKMSWFEIFKTNIIESKNIIKDLFKDPSSIKNMSHSLFIVSVSQAIGGLMGVFGSTAIGPTIRNIAGIGVDLSFLTDKKAKGDDIRLFDKSGKEIFDKSSSEKIKGLNFKSLFVWGGLTWVLAAVVDELKRLPFVESSINNLTNLSLVSDRGASLLYTLENLRIQSANNSSTNETPEKFKPCDKDGKINFTGEYIKVHTHKESDATKTEETILKRVSVKDTKEQLDKIKDNYFQLAI